MKRLVGTAMLALLAAMPALAQGAADAPTADPLARFGPKAPKGAPNIVIVLLDDVGFGATSAFGGPVPTPALDALAATGLRYNRFHTTAICSPTRSALLTGRNPHATGIGSVMNSVDSRPGYSGFHSKDTATIATVLRQNGYSTAAFGKWHQTPDWEVSPIGPFDRWPTGEGFDTFYGFQGGETDQFDPSLYEGTTPVMRPAGDQYFLTEDLAARASAWLRTQHQMTPDKPALLYFSTGGAHAPLQAPREWIDRFKGQFDGGWDAMRKATLKRQKALGVVPKDTVLTPRDAQLPAWELLTADQKRVAARQMEVYAAFLAHTDAQVGKLIETLKANGAFDNTLFFYIAGDNGSSGNQLKLQFYKLFLAALFARKNTLLRLKLRLLRPVYFRKYNILAWSDPSPQPRQSQVFGSVRVILVARFRPSRFRASTIAVVNSYPFSKRSLPNHPTVVRICRPMLLW